MAQGGPGSLVAEAVNDPIANYAAARQWHGVVEVELVCEIHGLVAHGAELSDCKRQ